MCNFQRRTSVMSDMNNDSTHNITVKVDPFYIEDQSAPDENRYVFAYTVNIQNTGTVAAKLMTRHWIITDANGKIQEVRGQGVVGEQPYLRPGEGFQYTSGAVLDTAVVAWWIYSLIIPAGLGGVLFATDLVARTRAGQPIRFSGRGRAAASPANHSGRRAVPLIPHWRKHPHD